MKQLQPDEVVATLSLWRGSGARFSAMLNTMQQFVIGIAEIAEATPDRIVVRLTEVMKRLELAPEEPFSQTVFVPADVVSAWQSPMFGNPKLGAMGEHSTRLFN